MKAIPHNIHEGHPKQREKEMEFALDMIAMMCIDYDGYRSVDGLKKLVDEIQKIAVEKKALLYEVIP